ncbi:hypothetical protein FKP32DRAFT_396917 [Trametes sanguinea]|nr:hypothetical protein FKP32DRAFT_396917 [Trametes sanguinea]
MSRGLRSPTHRHEGRHGASAVVAPRPSRSRARRSSAASRRCHSVAFIDLTGEIEASPNRLEGLMDRVTLPWHWGTSRFVSPIGAHEPHGCHNAASTRLLPDASLYHVRHTNPIRASWPPFAVAFLGLARLGRSMGRSQRSVVLERGYAPRRGSYCPPPSETAVAGAQERMRPMAWRTLAVALLASPVVVIGARAGSHHHREACVPHVSRFLSGVDKAICTPPDLRPWWLQPRCASGARHEALPFARVTACLPGSELHLTRCEDCSALALWRLNARQRLRGTMGLPGQGLRWLRSLLAVTCGIMWSLPARGYCCRF